MDTGSIPACVSLAWESRNVERDINSVATRGQICNLGLLCCPLCGLRLLPHFSPQSPPFLCRGPALGAPKLLSHICSNYPEGQGSSPQSPTAALSPRGKWPSPQGLTSCRQSSPGPV